MYKANAIPEASTGCRATLTEQRYSESAAAFDSVAPTYNGPAGNNELVQHMRSHLWSRVSTLAAPGARLLDLGCGTGIDAVHFAHQGYTVTAIDASQAMLEQTRLLAANSEASSRILTLHMGIQDIGRHKNLGNGDFDLIYSNMGALNCLANLASLAEDCAKHLSKGGHLVMAVMGKVCPWELLYYTLHADFARAHLRLTTKQIPVRLNGKTVWTSYYTPAEVTEAFSNGFTLQHYQALNLFLPPPYLIGAIERIPSAFAPLAFLDRYLGQLPVLRNMGDHFLLELKRRD